MGLTDEGRFWSRVNRTEGCWLWTGPVHAKGYARVTYRGTRVLGHRLAYALANGIDLYDLPNHQELQLDHLCRTRLCVNPEHLELVTRRENILRGESPAARHAAKTHCPRGHPYDADNTSIWHGQRYCLTCKRDRMRRLRSA